MFEQDYIKFHYNKDVLSITAFPPKGRMDSPAIEAEKSAFYYYKKYRHKKLILCLSGGMDSQVMAEAFLRAGVPFSVSIWKYKKNLNTYDIKSAIRFCNEHKIDYEIEECDLELFYRNYLHFYYGEKYLCDSPQVAVHLHFLERLSKRSGIALFLPWQPPAFEYNSYSKKVILKVIMYSRYLAYQRCFHLNHIFGTAYFLISRSALLHSFLRLPITKWIINQNICLKAYQVKAIMFRQGGFVSQPQKGKFTGFDKMKTVLMRKYKMDYNWAFRHPLIKYLHLPQQQHLFIYPVWEEDSYNKLSRKTNYRSVINQKGSLNFPIFPRKERQRAFI